MVEPDFRIKFDGGDADNAAMDMRLLGAALQGADKITSDGLILLIHGRAPKRRERLAVTTKVREPVEGSYELWALWEAIRGLLPLGLPKAADLAGFFIGEWWNAVIARFSGKPDVAEAAIKALVEMNRDHLAVLDASDARSQERTMALIAALHETLAMQGVR